MRFDTSDRLVEEVVVDLELKVLPSVGWVDLCDDCYTEYYHMLCEASDMEHPDYQDEGYRCYFCQTVLIEYDN